MKLLLPIQLYFYLALSKLLPLFIKPSPKEKSILYLAAFYPGNSGYHWRAKKWEEKLEEKGYTVTILHALEEKEFRDYSNSPALFMFRFLHRRFWQVIKARKYETVIVRREILIYNDYGNLFLEKLLTKLCSKRILDFDDDLAAAKKQPKAITSPYAKLMLENGNSFIESLQYYTKFSVASQYLKEYVQKYTSIPVKNIAIIPTCVDYDQYPAKDYSKRSDVFTFGWIGGDHNYFLLQNIIPILNSLAEKYKFKLVVIGGAKFKTDSNFPIINKKWSLDTEVEDLYTIDIGLMPLDTSLHSKGKGGFKLIQYMGLGIVGVAQNITINADIVDDKNNSFLYSTNEEFVTILTKILKEEVDLVKMGKLAKARINQYFSFNGNIEHFFKLISL